jgi:hypothetical protein
MGKSKSKKNPKQVVIDTPKSDVDSEDSEEVDGDDADDADEIDEITEETLTEEQGEELQVFLRSATSVMVPDETIPEHTQRPEGHSGAIFRYGRREVRRRWRGR